MKGSLGITSFTGYAGKKKKGVHEKKYHKCSCLKKITAFSSNTTILQLHLILQYKKY